jgi:hypothetical protein
MVLPGCRKWKKWWLHLMGLEALIQKIEKHREGATTDNFEIFRKRDKMMSQGLVKKSWNEKGVDSYSKWILASLKWQIPGAGRIGNSILVSFLPVTNS